ncbi:PREDICTED: UPF0544 protein C5orf45 homolog [Amphimedon queenslandica]|uniref:MRN complex-interacting protein N-terminal domain-containing protein n=2 Tax=Amphimedon queenslandica TaxID=400682 RepID=A0AAN0IKS9_AMPQE|nr:PREDICTED: UPF0544 protein C5orf45 homolog [Amphimedon queenslandica]|eukprot:XP_011402494.1 PREDICTED: UPF0544 protein C5orf45 homolog [Amphimedon queenslandica]
MPQTFRVLQCYSCKTFQVQQVKKSNKWTCKLCNEKQSVIKVYDQGSAIDCRKQVQRLNMTRKEKDDAIATCVQPPEGYSDVYSTESGDDSPQLAATERQRPATILSGMNGRWALFADPKESESDQDEGEDEGRDTFTTSRTEFEQICKKLRKEKSCVRSAQHRLTGFHPVSKRKPAGSDDSLKSSSTHSLPASLYQKSDSLFPYSSVGDAMDTMLTESVERTSSLKCLHSDDYQYSGVQGSYRRFEEEKDKAAEKPVSVASSGARSSHSKDSLKLSKWSKFLPQNIEEGDLNN